MTITQDILINRGEHFAAYFIIEDFDYDNDEIVGHVRERILDEEVKIEFRKDNGRITDATIVKAGISPVAFSAAKITVSGDDFEGVSLPAQITITGSASDDGTFDIVEIIDENELTIFHTFVGVSTGASISIVSPGRVGINLTATETLALAFYRGHWDLVTDFTNDPVVVYSGRVAIGTRITRLPGAGDSISPITYVDASQSNLVDLLDVGDPVDGQTIIWNASNQLWEAGAVGGVSEAISHFSESGTTFEVPTSELLTNFTIIENVGGNILTITTEGAETINGAASYALAAGWWAQLITVAGNYRAVACENAVAAPTPDLPVSSASVSSSGLVSTFTDTSDPGDGTITDWLYTFASATASPATSTSQNPVVTDTVAGTYGFTIKTTTEHGSHTSDSISYTISETVKPVASATHSGADLVSTFTDTSTISSGSIDAWLWTFADATTSAVQNPTFDNDVVGVGAGTHDVLFQSRSALGVWSDEVTISYTVSEAAASTPTISSGTIGKQFAMYNLGLADAAVVTTISDDVGGVDLVNSGTSSGTFDATGKFLKLVASRNYEMASTERAYYGNVSRSGFFCVRAKVYGSGTTIVYGNKQNTDDSGWQVYYGATASTLTLKVGNGSDRQSISITGITWDVDFATLGVIFDWPSGSVGTAKVYLNGVLHQTSAITLLGFAGDVALDQALNGYPANQSFSGVDEIKYICDGTGIPTDADMLAIHNFAVAEAA